MLVFLDADTVPAPGTVSRLAAWPTVLPDALVVGRRHHADLTGWSSAATVAWLGGDGPTPLMRPDPAWLADGYRTTNNLLDTDDRSYRYIISAVMACHRSLWDDLEGFDATRDVYGGDDWEFASRAYNNGAVLVHDPTAVAWHDEPDWAERDGGSKNDETLWLAEVIAEPGTRGPGVLQRDAAVLVTLPTAGAAPGALVATIVDLLTAVPDTRIHLDGNIPASVRRYSAADDRIQESPPTFLQCRTRPLARPAPGPAHWCPSGLNGALAAVGPNGCGRLDIVADDRRVLAEVVSTRAAARVRVRRQHHLLAELFGIQRVRAGDAELSPVDGDLDVAALFAGW